MLLKDFVINIRIEKVLHYLGANSSVDKNINVLLLKEIQEFYGFMQTFCIYKILDKNSSSTKNLINKTKDVSNLLKNSDKIIIFVCSIGQKIDDKIGNFLANKEIVNASIWDAIGSEAVEQCANYVNELIRKKMLLEDYLTTRRYSAGYGDWGLENNHKISEILELEKFGISINEYGLLSPQKTITAILGLERREMYDFNK